LQAFYDELPTKTKATATDPPTPAPTPAATATKEAPFDECYTYIKFSSDADGVAGVTAIAKEAWGNSNVGQVVAYTPRLNGSADNYKAGDVVAIPTTDYAPISLTERINPEEMQP
jgi:hypothetical protein